MSDGAMLLVKVLSKSRENNQVLIAVHGGRPGVSTHSDAETIFGFLTERFRVIVYDGRGSGISDATPPFSHERWTADIECLR